MVLFAWFLLCDFINGKRTEIENYAGVLSLCQFNKYQQVAVTKRNSLQLCSSCE